MTVNEITKKIEEIKELEELLEEVKAELETARDSLKIEMSNTGANELVAGRHIVRYTEVLSNRFDSTAFKKAMPEVYKAYTRQTTSRRFTIS